MHVPSRIALLAIAALAFDCASARREPDPPAFSEVQPLLDAKCARCHAGPAPAGGFRVDSYTAVIACTPDGRAPTASRPDAPLLAVLDRPDHADLLTGEERARLSAWVLGGAAGARAGVHPAAFGNPRSKTSHAAVLRADRYRPLLDPEHPDACARCHDGIEGRPGTITSGAPGATACTTCHAEPGFPFACATCHGPDGRSSRNPCFHEDARDDRTHRAHAGPSTSRADGLPCSSCHPVPADGRPSPTHVNGWKEIWFDFAVVGRDARWHAESKRCTGTCHSHGGARPEVVWGGEPMTCGDCHETPPVPHYPSPCTSCHPEANAIGTTLVSPTRHVDGVLEARVFPTSAAHPTHLSPASSVAVPCETCHVLPIAPGPVTVRLGGLAVKGGRRATFDPETKTCAGTYCHEGRGGKVQAPTWKTGSAARACGACHATPPPPPHPPSTTCGVSTCHEGITSGPTTITPAGKNVHVNGLVDPRVP